MGDQAYCVGGGGYGTSPPPQTSLYMYDLSDNAWTSKTGCTYRRYSQASGAGAAEDGYTFGNDEEANQYKTEKYSISGNSWTIKTDMPYMEWSQGSRPSPIGGKIYLTSLTYIYSADSWRAYVHGKYGKNMNVFTIGGYLYGAQGGGSSGGAYKADEEKYDPATESWTSIGAIGQKHGDCPAGIDDGTYGYEGGGYGYPSSPYQDNYWDRYDPSGNVWTVRAGMSIQAYLCGTFKIESGAHICTGAQTPSTSHTWNGRYDNSSNSWTSKTSFPGGYSQVCGFYVPGNLPPNAPTGLSASST